jgi:hypothetical protein
MEPKAIHSPTGPTAPCRRPIRPTLRSVIGPLLAAPVPLFASHAYPVAVAGSLTAHDRRASVATSGPPVGCMARSTSEAACRYADLAFPRHQLFRRSLASRGSTACSSRAAHEWPPLPPRPPRRRHRRLRRWRDRADHHRRPAHLGRRPCPIRLHPRGRHEKAHPQCATRHTWRAVRNHQLRLPSQERSGQFGPVKLPSRRSLRSFRACRGTSLSSLQRCPERLEGGVTTERSEAGVARPLVSTLRVGTDTPTLCVRGGNPAVRLSAHPNGAHGRQARCLDAQRAITGLRRHTPCDGAPHAAREGYVGRSSYALGSGRHTPCDAPLLVFRPTASRLRGGFGGRRCAFRLRSQPAGI